MIDYRRSPGQRRNTGEIRVKGGIEAVVFDYGKVISLPPEDSVARDIAALAGLPVKTMEDLALRFRPDYDRGLVSASGYYETLLRHGGVRVDAAVLERMGAMDIAGWSRINGETVRLMERIKAGGTMLGILSNMPWDFLAMARENMPVFRLPDAGIFSCETGTVKPEEAIYRSLISALDCRPGEIIFFDDIRVNVDAALSLGINAFVWQDPLTAEEILKQHVVF
ncbi:MAG: HAD family phosphatase [Spirochaetaceae bacterium]|jgi:putative hydrolase of the HAD superfamily|nr:HAD family phosphatase [Spirochaetaceae bacterium]